MTDIDNTRTSSVPDAAAATRSNPCTLVLFDASGDLTRRLLTPALYKLACDGLLPEPFGVVGVSKEDYTPTRSVTALPPASPSSTPAAA